MHFQMVEVYATGKAKSYLSQPTRPLNIDTNVSDELGFIEHERAMQRERVPLAVIT